MDLIRVPTYPETHEVNIFTVETYITRNTVCLVASAPNFSQGTIDDIEELGRIASSRGIGLHVDA
jgi:glutamate/tyrosine decarboxylase-like PLP-dependent enzyme